MARDALTVIAILGLGGMGTAQGVAADRRWPEAFRAADSAQARVEVLYGAGDLPGALQEALAGLRAHTDDPVLLRRACQLALALRIPGVAASSAAGLEARVSRMDGSDAAAHAWWSGESKSLSRDAADLEAREGEIAADVARARVVSLAGLGAVCAALVAWARTR